MRNINKQSVAPWKKFQRFFTQSAPVITSLGVITAIAFSIHQSYLLQERFLAEVRPWVFIGPTSDCLNSYSSLLGIKVDRQGVFFSMDITPEKKLTIKMPVVFENTGHQPAQIENIQMRLISIANMFEFESLTFELTPKALAIPSNGKAKVYIFNADMDITSASVPDGYQTPEGIEDLYKKIWEAILNDDLAVRVEAEYKGAGSTMNRTYMTASTFQLSEKNTSMTIWAVEMD